MKEDEKIDDIVALLDNFMGNGGGHMNIVVEEDNQVATQEISVQTYQSTDCSAGNQACAIPTIHKGIDDEL